MKFYTSVILFLSLIYSCSPGRKVHENNLISEVPSWVRQTPNTADSYHGVGMALKSNQQDYRERARQSALSELAASISVTISASSVLHQFEFDNNYSEFFRDQIKMSTRQQLEGFELVENWENEEQYWVYYRLSKIKWEQIRQERINRALTQSQAALEQARSFSEQGKKADAIRFYIQSVEAIRNFLGDELTIATETGNKSYAPALMADFINEIRDLKFVFPFETMRFKQGALQNTTTLDVKVTDRKGNPAAGIPVITKFSWMPASEQVSFTNANGVFSINIDKFKSGSSNGQISSAPDIKWLVENNSEDMLIHKLIDGIKVNTFILPVEFIPAVFHISLTEKNLGKAVSNTGLGDEIQKLFLQEGFKLTTAIDDADYLLEADIDTFTGNERNNRFSTNLKATFIIKNKHHTIVYSRSVENLPGLGDSYASAGLNAYRSLLSTYRITVYPDILRTLF